MFICQFVDNQVLMTNNKEGTVIINKTNRIINYRKKIEHYHIKIRMMYIGKKLFWYSFANDELRRFRYEKLFEGKF